MSHYWLRNTLLPECTQTIQVVGLPSSVQDVLISSVHSKFTSKHAKVEAASRVTLYYFTNLLIYSCNYADEMLATKMLIITGWWVNHVVCTEMQNMFSDINTCQVSHSTWKVVFVGLYWTGCVSSDHLADSRNNLNTACNYWVIYIVLSKCTASINVQTQVKIYGKLCSICDIRNCSVTWIIFWQTLLTACSLKRKKLVWLQYVRSC